MAQQQGNGNYNQNQAQAANQAASPKVVAIRTKDAIQLAGMERTYVDSSASWVIQSQLHVELEHAGGMSAVVKWVTRGEKGPMKHRCLVSCTQIIFEPTSA